jgi:hypothetical protein
MRSSVVACAEGRETDLHVTRMPEPTVGRSLGMCNCVNGSSVFYRKPRDREGRTTYLGPARATLTRPAVTATFGSWGARTHPAIAGTVRE